MVWAAPTQSCETKRESLIQFVPAATPIAAVGKTATPQGFNWNTAGLALPKPSDSWSCTICMVKNSNSLNVCQSCETVREGSTIKAQVTSKTLQIAHGLDGLPVDLNEFVWDMSQPYECGPIVDQNALMLLSQSFVGSFEWNM